MSGVVRRKKMSATSLDRFKKATVGSSTYVLGDIQAHVMSRVDEDQKNRRSDIMHPSEMAKPEWCWRHDYYRIKGIPTSDKVANPSFFMENIFQEGHEIHRKWQRWLYELGYLWGVFECKACQHAGWGISPRECTQCGNKRLRYKEVPLVLNDQYVAGHSDGGILKPYEDDEPRLLEVKSISLGTLRFEMPHLYQQYQDGVAIDKIWWQIQRPFPSHLRQGMLYLWLLHQGALPDVMADLIGGVPRKIVFVYEWKPTQSVKEFVVTYSEGAIKHLLRGVDLLGQAMERGKPPPRPKWAEDEDAKNCRSCPYRSTCYHLSVPYEHDPAQAQPLQVQRAKPAVRRRAHSIQPWQ